MRYLIKKISVILTVSLTIVFGSCAGPSSATVGVGVGVGVPRPYPGPPSTTIWIGRPTPRTLYNNIPAGQTTYYSTNDVTRPDTGSSSMLVHESE